MWPSEPGRDMSHGKEKLVYSSIDSKPRSSLFFLPTAANNDKALALAAPSLSLPTSRITPDTRVHSFKNNTQHQASACRKDSVLPKTS